MNGIKAPKYEIRVTVGCADYFVCNELFIISASCLSRKICALLGYYAA